jgi:hypothetical protein
MGGVGVVKAITRTASAVKKRNKNKNKKRKEKLLDILNSEYSSSCTKWFSSTVYCSCVNSNKKWIFFRRNI